MTAVADGVVQGMRMTAGEQAREDQEQRGRLVHLEVSRFGMSSFVDKFTQL